MLTQIKPPLVSGLWSLDPADRKPGSWFPQGQDKHNGCPDPPHGGVASSEKYTHVITQRLPRPASPRCRVIRY